MTDIDLEAIADDVFAAAEAGDWERFASHFAEGAVLRQNVGVELVLADALPGLQSFTADGTTLRYDNVRRLVGKLHATELHDAVFTKPDGREVRIDICVVMQFDGRGKITRVDEYLDSGAAAALFT